MSKAAPPPPPEWRSADGLRIALFSGNYNYVRDGANQALNRLVDYLHANGAKVRVYSPTVPQPAIPPNCEIIDIPSLPLPFGRGEYRLARALPQVVRDDISAFRPDVFHVSSPDILGHRAISMARAAGVPVLASLHTLFETYPAYYGLGFLESPLVAMLRRFYNRCDAVVAPSQVIIDRLRTQGIRRPVTVWSRGVDHTRFNPARRDLDWRRSFGIADDDLVLGFLGRVVLEKGLDVFADVSRELKGRGVPHRVLVIGDGPARAEFQSMVPEAVMVGFQGGDDLGRAVASLDILLNPSVTESFGNVNLESLAAGVPIVAADATGNQSLVQDGVTGRLVAPRSIAAYADAIQSFEADRGALAAAGRAGHDFAAAFQWDAVNHKVIDAYCSILPDRRG